jgi:hypothetical protein
MLRAIMLSVVMQSVVMLGVVAPFEYNPINILLKNIVQHFR